MSYSYEQKILEMRFDNNQFEKETSRTMLTIQKLKENLNFSKEARAFDEVDNSAKKFDISPLSEGLEAVKNKFSALSVVGMTALSNITNSAINAGKRMISALTIDPIKTGFSEYETQINSVQTILANTESKGSTLQDVNAALAELNTYADKTIYNFTEMTRNIGTFTAAGVDLKTATASIQGIANMAAVSGSTSQQASTAMYQLSQAMSAGSVKLQDWNSVVNAGMGGQVFQDALKETSRHIKDVAAEVNKMSKAEQDAFQKSRGYTTDQMKRFKNYDKDVDQIIKDEGSFRESLKQEWITAEVLTETLKKTTKTGVAEYLSDLTGVEYDKIKSAQEVADKTKDSNKAYSALAETMAKTGKITKQEAINNLKLADSAENAATKVKTFSQLWDTLQEAAQSGWTQSWQIMVGDFEEAKDLLTEISDAVGSVIGDFSDHRNNILSKGLSSGWKQFLNEGITNEEDFQKVIKETAKKQGVAANDIIKKSGSFQKSLKEGWLTSDILSASVNEMSEKLEKLSSEELKLKGYTKDDVSQLKNLNKQLKDGSLSAEDFVDKFSKNSGRENIIDGMRNSLKWFVKISKQVKKAYTDIFPSTGDDKAKGLYELTRKFKEFTDNLSLSKDKAKQVRTIFKGLFSVFDMLKKALTTVLSPITRLLGSDGVKSVGTYLLDTAESIAKFLIDLNKSFQTNGITGFLNKISDGISMVLKKTTSTLGGFRGVFAKVGEWVSNTAGKIWASIQNIFGWIGKNVSLGDVFKGLLGGGLVVTIKKIIDAVGSVGDILDDVKEKISGFLGGEKEDGGGLKEKISDILGSLKDSIKSFTTGIKTASLLLISVSIGILTHSLETLSKLNVFDIGKSLGAIGSMLGGLILSFKALVKTLNKYSSKGLNKAAFSMILMAYAIKILSGAIVKLSSLSLKEIGKGLAGVGGGLAELCIGVRAISSTKVSLKTAFAMIAIAYACKTLGDAMKKFSGLSWPEIGRGLTSMAGALAELIGVIKIMNKISGSSSILGSIGIFIIIQSLGKLANALKKFGSMEWPEIGRGLAAMGGALAELAIVTGALGKLTGFSGLLGSISLDVIIPFLNTLANALRNFGSMEWSEIGRGIVAMGGALAETAVVVGALGKLTGFAGIIGAISLDVIIPFLDTLANALRKFGSMEWPEIGKGIVAMGGALAETAVVIGALGKLTGFAGVIGAISLDVIIPFLDTLSDALRKFGSMEWPEIGRGLAAMGGALGELGVGGLLNTFSGLGAINVGEMVGPLNELAEALTKFGEIDAESSKIALENMAGALSETALGGILNTFSGLGSVSISSVAEPLGTLADSVKKWVGLSVPGDLGKQLGSVATAVTKFTLGGIGSSAIASAAGPLGDLADSVRKWAGLTVPDDLGDSLSKIAGAINNFIFGGVGSLSLESVAGPLGTMADSVKKWEEVKIPSKFGSKLKSLSEGVKAWSWAFAGGWSMDAVIDPLSRLPDAIIKWKDVKLPKGIKERLTSLSKGVEAWSWCFAGGFSMDVVIDPLSRLPDAIIKWKDVKLPKNVKGDLISLSEGVKSWSWTFTAAWGMGGVADHLGDLATAISKWKNVKLPSNVVSDLTSLSEGVKSWSWTFTAAWGMNGVADHLGDLATAIKKWKDVKPPKENNLQELSDSIKKFITDLNVIKGTNSKYIIELSNSVMTMNDAISSIKTIKPELIEGFIENVNKLGNISVDNEKLDEISKSVSEAIEALLVSLNNSISESTASDSMETLMDRLIAVIGNKAISIKDSMLKTVTKALNAVKSKKSLADDAFKQLVSNCHNAVRSNSSDMYTAGEYLAEGLIRGIKSKGQDVYEAAKKLGEYAVKGELKGQDSQSPSKATKKAGVYFGEGFIIGLEQISKNIYNTSRNLGDSAVDSLSDTITNIGNDMDSNIDIQPTIRPVLDLSDVKSEANGIGRLLKSDSLSVTMNAANAIGSSLRGNENGNDIVTAINGLRKTFENSPRNNYNINGITYDDGSNVSSAVETLIRAARIERRV